MTQPSRSVAFCLRWLRPNPRRRLTDERLAAICLYSERDRRVRKELQTKAPQPSWEGGRGASTKGDVTSDE